MTTQPNQSATSAKLLQHSPQRQKSLNPENAKLWGSKRLMVAIFMFFGHFYSFMLKGNLSIAIVEMTSNKTIVQGNLSIFEEPEFDWDSKTKAWILSLLSYGSVFAAVGGYLSSNYGGVTVSGSSILIAALLTASSPSALHTNLYVFAIGRIAEGILENFAYTGICDAWSRWIPKHELPKIISCSHSGYYVGAAVTFPICGFVAHYYGWPMTFYFSGSIGIVWSLLLFLCIQNDPRQEKNISVGELQYIRQTIRHIDRKTMTYPWKKIITCKPLWVLCFNKFAYSWAHITLAYSFPLYIKDITNESIAIVGILSGVPNYINLFAAPLSGLLIDYLQNNRGFNSSKLHKRILTAGFLLAGLLFGAVGFSSFIISMICFVFIVILLSINFNILQITVVCISPDHAGLVAGISAQWYSLSSLLSSLAIGFIVTNRTWQEWSMCFGLSGGILIAAAMITLLFGSSDNQKWSFN